MSKKGVVVAKSSGMVVGTASRHALHLGLRMRLALLILGVLVIAGVVVGGVLWHNKQVDDARKATALKQQKLQKNVTDANSVGNIDKLKTDSSNLIQGTKSGAYTLSNKQLAQAYVSRADAELNKGDYKSAVADYQKAAQLDSAQSSAAEYGEFLGRYRLGERKTLIPLLQELERPLENDHESFAQQQLALYEQYISDLQTGKDLGI